ncbi:MgtC/SapB family protein [uncultured Marixanthomonas sp.]|uniref:MgtC/SapB family protein n=1 Tax=uncultured Marixanthomonas sp. TaxID=757245 RepID=UPI0030D9F945|tara:strand:+ start:57641 stop:58078 length:438 start_codon:yes stop_codon:yes gene_type:complete
MDIEFTDFLLKSIAALVAGFFMGLERQMKGKHAGLKTNMLVTMGAAIYVMIALTFINHETTDMTRIIGQIVVGVGFLGAGVILRSNSKRKVEGLATAATIWCCAAAGCLAGMGIYDVLAGFTVLVVVVNIVFGYLNKKVSNNTNN